MIVEFHGRASAELDDAVDYYEQRKSHLGREFADEVRAAIKRIREFPNARTLIDEGLGLRRCQPTVFPLA